MEAKVYSWGANLKNTEPEGGWRYCAQCRNSKGKEGGSETSQYLSNINQ